MIPRILWPLLGAIVMVSAAGAEAPTGVRSCAGCHRSIVASYLEHGMARAVASVGTPRGEEERARSAIARARAIQPSLVLPGAGSVTEH